MTAILVYVVESPAINTSVMISRGAHLDPIDAVEHAESLVVAGADIAFVSAYDGRNLVSRWECGPADPDARERRPSSWFRWPSGPTRPSSTVTAMDPRAEHAGESRRERAIRLAEAMMERAHELTF